MLDAFATSLGIIGFDHQIFSQTPDFVIQTVQSAMNTYHTDGKSLMVGVDEH